MRCVWLLQRVLMAHALRRISYATCEPAHSQFGFLAREPHGQFNLQFCHSFVASSSQQVCQLLHPNWTSTRRCPCIFRDHRSGKSVKSQRKKNNRSGKVRENASKVSIYFLFWPKLLQTVLWLWSRRRVDKQRHWYSQTFFGARRANRRKMIAFDQEKSGNFESKILWQPWFYNCIY